MQYSKVLAFAASASAFLVVPEMLPPKSNDVEGEFKALPVADINPFALPPSIASQTVDVPCAECPGEDATVRFEVEVHDNTRLLVNGFEVFPADDVPTGDMMATVSSMGGTEVSEHVLSWMIWWQVVEVDQEQDMRILDHHINVGLIGNLPVNSVALTTTLVEGPNGELMIASVSVPEPQTAEDVQPACDSLLCRVKDFFKSLTKGRMGCHKAHQEMVAVTPGVPDEPAQDDEHDGRPQPHHLGKMIKNVAGHIVVPVILGISAGVCAAVFVMFLCSAVAFVARKVAGRETRCSWAFVPSDVIVIEEEPEEEDEKAGLMERQAPPPAYEPVEKE